MSYHKEYGGEAETRRGKVKTPVVFCGVNNDASKYGYPSSNVTGILEKKHYRESISFAQMLDPGIRKLGIVYRRMPANDSNLAQIFNEKESYTAEITRIVSVETLNDTILALQSMEKDVDALLTMNLTGITDSKGRKMDGKDTVRLVSDIWKKPTITDSAWQLREGYLCGVIKQMFEQGATAALMVKEILDGKELSEIPVTWNKNGIRMFNLSTGERIGLRLSPDAAIGTEIVLSK